MATLNRFYCPDRWVQKLRCTVLKVSKNEVTVMISFYRGQNKTNTDD